MFWSLKFWDLNKADLLINSLSHHKKPFPWHTTTQNKNGDSFPYALCEAWFLAASKLHAALAFLCGGAAPCGIQARAPLAFLCNPMQHGSARLRFLLWLCLATSDFLLDKSEFGPLRACLVVKFQISKLSCLKKIIHVWSINLDEIKKCIVCLQIARRI